MLVYTRYQLGLAIGIQKQEINDIIKTSDRYVTVLIAYAVFL